MRVEPLNQRDPVLALAMQTVWSLAQAQESRLLLRLSPADADPEAEADAPTAQAIQANPAFFLGAWQDQTLSGLLAVAPDDEPQQLCLQTLVVHPHMQRQGVARLLVQTALARAPSATFAVVTAAANLPALRLYASLGFGAYRHGTVGPRQVAVVKLRRVGGVADVATPPS